MQAQAVHMRHVAGLPNNPEIRALLTDTGASPSAGWVVTVATTSAITLLWLLFVATFAVTAWLLAIVVH